MTQNTNEAAGFGTVGVVIVAIAMLVAAGVVGWRIWDANKSNQTTTQPITSTNNNNAGNGTPVDTATYLDIKELGIKIKLSEDIKDAVYYYDTQFNNQYPDSQQVTISTQSLIDKSNGDCKASLGIGPLGTVHKVNSDVDGLGRKLTVDGQTTVKLGDAYFTIATPQSPCSADAIVEALAANQRSAFFEAFKTIQSDK